MNARCLVIGGLLLGGCLSLRADVITLKSGQNVEGKIAGTDGKTLTVESDVAGQRAQVKYPLALVDKLVFVDDDATKTLLASNDPKDLPELAKLWESRQVFLGQPESNAGAVALAYARLLLKSGGDLNQVLALSAEVESGDWQVARKPEATRLRLAVLVKSGKSDQALAEAEKIGSAAGADDDTLLQAQVQARFTGAEVAWAKLQQLERDWPKWALMPDKRVERQHLLDKTLDGFLYPVVFQSQLRNLCAEGLYRSAEIECLTGSLANAAVHVQEIITYYANDEFKAKAENLIKQYQLTLPAKGGDNKGKNS
ncbi:MAG: hypothetical protein LBH01_11690 [Verrucomicrobiales bacterium]|jgi:hypothetical protein|nr:hypothetical protein [Verrucomicrobiales bacterium]